MTTTNEPPARLPGVSANAWRTAISVIGYAGIPAVLFAFTAEFLHWRGPIFAWFIPIFVLLVALYCATFLGGRRAKREVAAGYTTLWRSNPTVPQLDAATGALVRGAGEPYVTKSDWKAGPAVSTAPYAPAASKPTFWQRLVPSLPQFMVVFVLIIASALWGRLAADGTQVIGLVVAGSLVVVLIGTFTITGAVGGSRLKRLRIAEPNDFAFMVAGTDKISAAIASMSSSQLGVPQTPLGVTANSAGLSFWAGNPPTKLGTLPWDRVTSVQADRVTSGNSWRGGVLITYKDDAGTLQEAALAGANADRVEFRSMPEANWIASVLNELRSGTTTARVL